ARRAYGVIAQLERSAHRQEQLVADARSARADLQQSDVLRQKQQLQHQSEELRQKISGAGGEEVSALRKQLQETNNRLRRIETDRKSTRLNSSHVSTSYAVFCLKKKTAVARHTAPLGLPVALVIARRTHATPWAAAAAPFESYLHLASIRSAPCHVCRVELGESL